MTARKPPADPIAACAALAARTDADPRALAKAAGRLFESPNSAAVVPVLVALLKHVSPIVRIAAASALVAHPYPVAIVALAAVAEGDHVKEVREEAEEMLSRIEAAPFTCLHCGGERARLVPEPSSDPEGEQLPKPMFCDEPCAVAYALELGREEHHPCLTLGRWEPGPASACSICISAARVGAA